MEQELENPWLYLNPNQGLETWQFLQSHSSLCNDIESFISINENTLGVAIHNLTSGCFSRLEIYNNQATSIVLNINGFAKFIGKISMTDGVANLTIITNSDLTLSNIITENIESITIYGRAYKGIDLIGQQIQVGDYFSSSVQIEHLSVPSLIIEAHKLSLIGNFSAKNFLFNFDSINTMRLDSLSGDSLSISGNNVFLSGNYQLLSFLINSANLYLDKNSQIGLQNGYFTINLKEVFRNDGTFIAGSLNLSCVHMFNKGRIYTNNSIWIANNFLQQGIIGSEGNVTIRAPKIVNQGNITSTNFVLKATSVNLHGEIIASIIDINTHTMLPIQGALVASTLNINIAIGPVVNNRLIQADVMALSILNGDFINNWIMSVTNQATWSLASPNSIYFSSGSITKVGSFIVRCHDNIKIDKIECKGCTFTAESKDAISLVKANNLNIEAVFYTRDPSNKYQEKTYTWRACGEKYWDFGWHRDRWDESRNAIGYKATHSMNGKASFKIAGSLDLDVGIAKIYLSEFVIENTGNFLEPTILELGAESITQYVDIPSDVLPHYNHAQIAKDFGLTNYFHENNNLRITQVLETLRGVCHITNAQGKLGNLVAVGLTTGLNVPALAGSSNEVSTQLTSNVLALVKQGAFQNIVLARHQNSPTVSIITYQGNSIITTTIDIRVFFESKGLDLRYLVNRGALHPMWEMNLDSKGLIAATGNQIAYIVQMNPIDAKYLNSFSVEQFLEKLAFEAQGGFWVLQDGFYLEKLINDVVFQILGRLSGYDNTQLLTLLAENALDFYKKTKAIPGKNIPSYLKKEFDLPLIWPVWVEDCSQFNKARCLSFELYLNDKSVTNMLEGATFSTEIVNLMIHGSVLIDSLSQIKIGQQLSLQIDNHAIILGRVTGGTQEWDVKENLINLGKIETIGDLVINALNILLSGTVKSSRIITASAIQELVIRTLHRVTQYSGYGKSVVRSEITSVADIQAAGRASFTSGKDMKIIGASVIGNEIYIKSEDGKVSVIPVELYNEVSNWGRRYYNSYKALVLYRSSLESSLSNIEISADGGILLSGVISNSAANTDIQTIGKTLVESPSEYIQIESWSQKRRGGIAGLCGGKKTTSKFSSVINAITSIVHSVKDLISISGEDQYWIGADVKAYSAKLKAGSPEREAMIMLASAKNVKEIKVMTKTSGFSLNFNNGMMNVVTSSRSAQGEHVIMQIPTIFQVEDQFLGYANGKWIQLSSKIKSDGTVVIDAQDITLTAAPDIQVTYAHLDSSGFGVGFSDKKGEFAIKAALWKKSANFNTVEENYNQVSSIVANFIKMKSDTITTYGALLDAAIMDLDAKIIYHGVLKNSITQIETRELLEAGLKLGIKSNIGQIFEGAKGIKNQDYSRPEGYVNSAFAALKLYDNVLELLSKNTNYGISGGIWFYAHYEREKVQTTAHISIPTIIRVSELLNSTSDTLKLIGTQISSYNAFIKTKYLDARNTENEISRNIDRKEFDVEIPIEGNVSPSISNIIKKANQYQKIIINTNINIAGHLSMEVQGHADLRGVFISAKSIDAFFESLLLESVQDIIENKGTLTSLGINFNSDGLTGMSPGFQKDRHSRHVVERISAIIGDDSAHIVVANALRLNGAMIAAAQRDQETGKYTDHGNLVLKVGELFIQHIRNFDNGYTLGASMSFKQKMDGQPKVSSVEPTIGGHKKDGQTYATIGKGNVEINEHPEILDQANRNVNEVQSWNTHYDIKAITLYYNNIDRKALKEGIPDTPEEWVKGVSQYIKSTLLPSSNINKDLTEEQLNIIKEKAEVKIKELKKKAENLPKKDQEEIKRHNKKQVSELIKVKQDLDDIQSDYSEGKITTETTKIKILKRTAELIRDTGTKYTAFAEEHPTLAEYGLSGVNIAIQTAIGSLAGFINSIKSEAIGHAVGAAIGEEISSLINGRVAEAATTIQKANPELDKDDATSIATGLVLGGVLITFGTMGAKQLLKDLSKIKVPGVMFKNVMSSITYEQKAILESFKNMKISPNALIQQIEDSKLFKKHFDGKPIRLENHEGCIHKGHTDSQHVSKGSLDDDVKFLVKRNLENPRLDSISSMYPSKEIAERVTTEVLLHNEAAILKWFKNKHDNSGAPFYMEFKEKMGYGVIKADNKLEFFNIARVYLRKKGNSIKIETSFPVSESRR